MAQGTTKGVPIDTDGTLAANSDALVASQKATKTYADTKTTLAAVNAQNLSVFAATTSAQLRGILSDENGTGVALFDNATSPTFITPALGTPSALVLTNATALPAAQVSVGALANGMTATTQTAEDNSTKLATTAYVDRLSRYLAQSNTDSASSGAAETLVYSKLISNGTVGANDTLRAFASALHGTSATAHTMNFYWNTSAALAGATLWATFAAANRNISLVRNFNVVTTGTQTTIISAATSVNTDEGASNNIVTTVTYTQSFAADIYFIVSLQTAAGTSTMKHAELYLKKAI